MDGDRKPWRYGLKGILALFCLLLSGCGTSVLFNALEEQEVNEMIALLQQHGIAGTKIIGKESCALSVASDNFSTAVDLLQSYGYPLPKYLTLGEVFKKSGLVSSPLEERIRFMNSLAESVALTLSKIPDVLKARVHIVIPENDPYAEHVVPSSAAVFIAYRQNAPVEDYVKQIKYLVTNSVEGLSPEKVSVAFFPITLPPLPKAVAPNASPINVLGIDISDADKMPFFMLIGGLLLVILLLIGALVWMWISTKRKKKEKTAEIENLAEASDVAPATAEEETQEESLD